MRESGRETREGKWSTYRGGARFTRSLALSFAECTLSTSRLFVRSFVRSFVHLFFRRLQFLAL